jgi:hypothetical protein
LFKKKPMLKRRRSFQKSTEQLLQLAPPSVTALSKGNQQGKGEYGTVHAIEGTNGVAKLVPVNPDSLGSISSPFRAEHSEPRMTRLLAEHVVATDASPHLMLPHGEHFVNSDVAVSFIENAEYKDLANFLKTRQPDGEMIRVILFQITYTLAVIQKLFPDFRHNDLHCENVMVRQCTDTGYTQYNYGRRTFYVPNLGFSCMIGDLDFACIRGLIDNYKVIEFYCAQPGQNISYHRDHASDLYFFIRTLYAEARVPFIFSQLDILYGDLLRRRGFARLPPNLVHMAVTPDRFLTKTQFFSVFHHLPSTETVKHVFGIAPNTRALRVSFPAWNVDETIREEHVRGLSRYVPLFCTREYPSRQFYATWPDISKYRKKKRLKTTIDMLDDAYDRSGMSQREKEGFMRVVRQRTDREFTRLKLAEHWYLATGLMVFIDLAFEFVGKGCAYSTTLFYLDNWAEEFCNTYSTEELLQFALQWSWLK